MDKPFAGELAFEQVGRPVDGLSSTDLPFIWDPRPQAITREASPARAFASSKAPEFDDLGQPLLEGKALSKAGAAVSAQGAVEI